MLRTELNKRIRALAHGTLGLTEDEYRTIVSGVYEKSEGHISRCDDEHANLVWLQLCRMRDGKSAISRPADNMLQQKFIARLMQHLGWNWQRTAEYCRRLTGKNNTRKCNTAELSKIIRGMIATIDHHLTAGKIVMTPAQRQEYEMHTKRHRGAKVDESLSREVVETKNKER